MRQAGKKGEKDWDYLTNRRGGGGNRGQKKGGDLRPLG